MYTCSRCNTSVLKWTGKCPQCSEWNTLTESAPSWWWKSNKKSPGVVREKKTLSSQWAVESIRMKSSSSELDGVFGDGVVPGSLILLSGEPWIWKSTLSLQMSDWYWTESHPVLYISWEEHIGQIASRAKRLWIQNEYIRILATGVFEDIISTIESGDEWVIIIDSISVLWSEYLEGSSGSISQIRTMTEALMEVAKRTQKIIILIGHVTKDGAISGPKALEHLVDVVLFLEGSRYENYRILRSYKNRFGPTDMVGLFRMTENGLIDIQNPGMEFVSLENTKLSWSALSITMEGNRPILIELEALTTYTKFWYPKRSSRWINQGKLDLLIAVLTKYSNTKLDSYDVYINIWRGLSIHEPWIDMACMVAMMSSRRNMTVWRTLFLGEVSLTGVIKNVFLLERRIQEAAKLGFHEMYIPTSYDGKIPSWIEVVRVWNVSELANKLGFNSKQSREEDEE